MTRDELVKAQRIIPIGRTFAVVDPEDYEAIRCRDWTLKRTRAGKLIALTRIKNESGLQTWYLHHAICTRAFGPRLTRDQCCQALNGDYLDCRRANVRWRDKMAVKLEAMRAGKAAKTAG